MTDQGLLVFLFASMDVLILILYVTAARRTRRESKRGVGITEEGAADLSRTEYYWWKGMVLSLH